MSVTGKNTKSIRKQEFKESRNLAQGFTKLTFAHKASLGDTVINLGSLITPTEMSALGFTNPSPSRLAEAKLFQFKKNLTLVSSLRGILQQDLSYRVNSSSTIKLEFSAADGEIFTGIIDSNPTSGIKVVDAKIQTAEGDLSDGTTDFAIGFTTKTTSNELIVFRNGLQQKRNSNNSSSVLDGNYYVVDSGSGYGSIIRFNAAPSGQDDYIFVSSAGNIIESPTDSSWAEIEKVQGQIDSIVPTVASLAGVPETDFQAAPNNVDLKVFGDRVIGLEEPGLPGSPKLATVSVAGALKKNKIQTKILTGDVINDGVISDLTFNNLVVGKWYDVKGTIALEVDSGAQDTLVDVVAVHNSVTLNSTLIQLRESGDTDFDQFQIGVAFSFKATTTTLTFQAASATIRSFVRGSGARNRTYIQLEERNDLIETTDFT